MKGTAILILLLGLTMFASKVSAESSHLWLDEMIDAVNNNSSTLEEYTDCLLNKAECSTMGEIIKDKLEVYIRSSCTRCPTDEKQKLCRLIIIMEEKRQKLLEEIMNQFGSKLYRRNLSGCRAYLREKSSNQGRSSVSNQS